MIESKRTEEMARVVKRILRSRGVSEEAILRACGVPEEEIRDTTKVGKGEMSVKEWNEKHQREVK